MSRSKVPVGGWFTSYDVRYDDHRPTDGTIVFRESDSARLHKQQPEESCDGGRGVSPHVHVGISTAIQAADAGTVLAAPSTRALRRNLKTTHTGVVKILDFYSAALRSQLQLSQPFVNKLWTTMIIPVTIQACLQSTVKLMVAQDTNHHTHTQQGQLQLS